MDPPWMSEFIKSKIHQHNSIYKKFQNNSWSAAEYDVLQRANAEVSEKIYKKKSDYYNILPKNCQTLQLILKHTGLY